MAMHMPTNDSQPGYDNLVGDCSETIAVVDHITTCVLLDTGSMVTTISKSIVQAHFSGLPTYPICDILQVKGPLDETLPYNKFIELEIGIPVDNETHQVGTFPILIAPDTAFIKDVPLLKWNQCVESLL